MDAIKQIRSFPFLKGDVGFNSTMDTIKPLA